MKRILTVEVYEGQEHGNWNIKARDSEGNCLSSAGTMFWDMPILTEQQVKILASWLVHQAQDWMEGNRDSPERT